MKRTVYFLVFAMFALGAAHSQSAAQTALFDRFVNGTGFAAETGKAGDGAAAQEINVHNAVTGERVGAVAKTTNQYVDYVIRSAGGKDFSLEDYAFLAYTEFLGADGKPVSVSTVSGTLKQGEAASLASLAAGGTLKLNDVFRAVHERDSLVMTKEGPARAPDAKTYEKARYLHVYAFAFRDAAGKRNFVRVVDEHTVGSGGKKF